MKLKNRHGFRAFPEFFLNLLPQLLIQRRILKSRDTPRYNQFRLEYRLKCWGGLSIKVFSSAAESFIFFKKNVLSCSNSFGSQIGLLNSVIASARVNC